MEDTELFRGNSKNNIRQTQGEENKWTHNIKGGGGKR